MILNEINLPSDIKKKIESPEKKTSEPIVKNTEKKEKSKK